MDIFCLCCPSRTWLAFLLIFIAHFHMAACYFELSPSDHEVCHSGVTGNSTVDLVCRVPDHFRSRGTDCKVKDITWMKSSGLNTFEISSSAKYAVYESVKGFGAGDETRVSLLRVMNFGVGDIARYSCHVSCDYGSGLNSVVQLHSDACLRDRDLRGMQCPVLVRQDTCSYNFRNGRCDGICNSRDHLYDGHDCAAMATGECADPKCASRYADGTCNMQCNTRECQWDGGDCINSALDLARDSILLKVERVFNGGDDYEEDALKPTHRQFRYRTLAKYLSRETQQLLRIIPVPRTDAYFEASEHASVIDNGMVPYQFVDSRKAFDNVVLKVDNTQCGTMCLRSVQRVTQYLHLSNIQDKVTQDLNMNIQAITVLKDSPKQCSFTNTSVFHIDSTSELTDSSEQLPNIGANDHVGPNPETDTNPQSAPSWSLSYWVIALCVVGALVIVGLLVAIFGVMVSIRREQRNRAKELKKNERIYSPFHKDKNLNTAVEV